MLPSWRVGVRRLLVASMLVACFDQVWAAPDPALIIDLRSRPTDRARLVTALKERLASRQYEDAYLLARYLFKYLDQRSAKMHEILGLCAYKTGDTTRAARFARQALALDPQSRSAQKLQAALAPAGAPDTGMRQTAAGYISSEPPRPRPEPLPSPSAATPGATPASARQAPDDSAPAAYRQAYAYFHEDRLDTALQSADEAVAAQPAHLDSQLLRARILATRLDLDEAAKVLRRAAAAHPAEPKVLLALGELAWKLSEVLRKAELLTSAERYFRQALQGSPNDPHILMTAAAFFYTVKETRVGESLRKRAKALGPLDTRELLRSEIAIELLQRRYTEGLALIQNYSKRFGPDAAVLYQEGLALLSLDRKEEGGECLEKSLVRQPQTPAMVQSIVSSLLTMDQAKRALHVVSAAEAAFPSNEAIAALREQVKMRVVTDSDLVTRTEGPFEITYPRSFDKLQDKVMDTIMDDFRSAYEVVSKIYGHRPNLVKIRVTLDTAVGNPAYYTPDTDTITIAARHFVKRSAASGSSAPDATREYCRHMVRHEFSHLVFTHTLGLADSASINQTIPLWLNEGLAEWVAGGLDTLPATGAQLKAPFASGFIAMGDLHQALSVEVSNADTQLNLKAYVQSYFMVKSLVSKGTTPQAGFDQVLGFCKALVASKGRVEASLLSQFNLSPAAFQRLWQDRLKADLVDNPTPDLVSHSFTAGTATVVSANDLPTR